MKTFIDWAKDQNLPVEVSAEDATGASENTKRAGISDNYPDAYAQKKLYPPAYFAPITSTAKGKLDGKIGS